MFNSVEMSGATEEQLLQMSITGKLPPHLQQSFDAEKGKGNTAYREGRFQDAISHYTDAENINPLSPVPPANRAMVYIKMSNFQKARDEAAIAHGLHNALPEESQSEKLLVKILLRRATANKELNLFAMAAEDFQKILDIEDNDQAKMELEFLKETYRITPTPSLASNRKSAEQQSKIEVLPNNVNGSSHPASKESNSHHNGRHPAPTHVTQNDTPLVQLSQSVMDNLTSKLSAVPPKTALEFERAWKSLQSNKLAQARYLLETVGPKGLKTGILGESLTPQLLERFVQVLNEVVTFDPRVSSVVSDVLFALTKVSRFAMLLMFFSEAEKRPLSQLLDLLQKNGVSQTDIGILRTSYS